MNRIKAYGMILLGVPAGYIASYFMQASTLRLPLWQYIMSAHKVLLPTVFDPLVNDSEQVVKDASFWRGVEKSPFLPVETYVTAFVGIFIGVLAFGAIAYASEVKSKKQD